MKIKKLNKKYCQLNNLNDLILEQDKLDIMLNIKEVELRHDLDVMKDSLSPANLFSMITGKFMGGGFISGITSGFSFITSLFKKRGGCKK